MSSATETQANEEAQGSLWGLAIIFIGIAMVIAFVIFTISNKAAEANKASTQSGENEAGPDSDNPSGSQFNAIVLQATAYKDQSAEEQKGIQEEGKKLFTKHACHTCHLMAGIAPSGFAIATLGPDLSDIGQRHDLRFITESILVPNAKIAEPQEKYTISGKSKMPSYNHNITDESLGKMVYWLSLQKGK